MTEWNVSKEAAQLHKDAHVWDMTMPWGGQDSSEIQRAALERAVAHGCTLVSLTIAADRNGLADTIQAIAGKRAYFLANSDKYALVDTFADVERAKRDGKLAIVFHFQGTNPVEGDLNMVETYHQLGIRHMLMAYNCKNLVGDGCTERTDDGLSRFGVALIEEMNRVGMIVDATHTGYRTTMDMFEVSTDPVIFSHSNPSALWDIPRNIKDDQIKASVKSGGVICVNGVDIFLGMEGGFNRSSQHVQFDWLRPFGGPISMPLRRRCSVVQATASGRRVAPHLAGDRRRCSLQPASNMTYASSLGVQKSNLLTFLERQVTS